MSSYSFADQYRAANIAPGPEIIRLRQDAVEKMLPDLDDDKILDLTRIYFGLNSSSENNWFRDAFLETDPSFSLIDNKREASVLSVCLLSAALANDEMNAALIPVIASASGHREPLLQSEFIHEARQALIDYSFKSRNNSFVDLNKIKIPGKSKVGLELDKITAEDDITSLSSIVKLSSNEASEALQNGIRQIQSVIVPLVNQVSELREEVSMLWWLIGNHSRILNKPFSELDIGGAAIMAGFDLAVLTHGDSSPVATPAILQRIINSRSKPSKKSLSLDLTVNSLPSDLLQSLNISSGYSKVADLCVVTTAIIKSQEIGQGEGWYQSFKKTTGLDAKIQLSPLNLAIQMYQEALLISKLS
ncbi:GTPase-associated system all-helical protein GASH [Serratia plymuthica]|uniref:GTPase-associated system all-helical protein GASH n=1 Tax=Serratia plymuthica TaxID=82996 RepID=UPI0007EB9A7D|nr:GTPase-associated system all-helical protein GASH [Serratia plymuthica]ANJ97470.1 hypothetical protein ADP73_05725 [Serratia plymuthica]